MKEVSIVGASVNSTQTGTVVQINSSIAQGDTIADRTGNKITSRSVDVLYSYVSGASNSSGAATVALVWDATPNGTAPAFATIFDTTTSFAGQALLNSTIYRDRFKVIWIDFLPDICVSEDGWVNHKRHYVQFRPDKHKEMMNVRYASVSGVVPTTGALYLCFGDTKSTTNTAQISYRIKYKYTDS